jgi:hypothetical protein
VADTGSNEAEERGSTRLHSTSRERGSVADEVVWGPSVGLGWAWAGYGPDCTIALSVSEAIYTVGMTNI